MLPLLNRGQHTVGVVSSMDTERPPPAERHDEARCARTGGKYTLLLSQRGEFLVEQFTELDASCSSIKTFCTSPRRAFIFHHPRHTAVEPTH